jgi:hypothetical protein
MIRSVVELRVGGWHVCVPQGQRECRTHLWQQRRQPGGLPQHGITGQCIYG